MCPVMLRVFHQFDPQERDKVTPRDFCLAVSVLIDGGGVRRHRDDLGRNVHEKERLSMDTRHDVHDRHR